MSSYREPEIIGSDEFLPEWLTATIEAPPKPGEERPFYFEDSQVVLQANHNISRFPSTPLTPSSNTGRGTEVQNPSLLLN